MTSIMHCEVKRWHSDESTGLVGSIPGPDLSFIYKRLIFFTLKLFLNLSEYHLKFFIYNLDMVMPVLPAFSSSDTDMESM